MKRIMSVLLFSGCLIFSQELKVDQKVASLQNNVSEHIRFDVIKELPTEENGIYFRRIRKALLFDEKVFVLDWRQSILFVLNENGECLYTIGRFGQGPGELEYPADLYISQTGEIFILNNQSEKLDKFSQDGVFLGRIAIKKPKNIYCSNPMQILIDSTENIFITYSLSDNLIDVFDPGGDYIKTLIKRKHPVEVPGHNIGNSTMISFDKQGRILAFNDFSGIFTLISAAGDPLVQFSAHDDYFEKEYKRILKQENKKNVNKVSSSSFSLWTDFWIGDDDRIYVCPKLKREQDRQRIFCFSPEGDLLYTTSVPEDLRPRINKAHYYNNKYLFITPDEKIFLLFGRRE